MELSLEWGIGIILAAHMATMGWIWKLRATDRKELIDMIADVEKRVDRHDERMRQGITYAEAERLIDLKMEVVRAELNACTSAVTALTEELRRTKGV